MGISERSDLCIPQHLLNQVISQMRTFAAISIILSLSLVASIPVEKEYDDTVRTINNDVTHIALVDRDGTVIDTAPIFTDMQTKQAWWSARRRRKVSWFGHIGKTIKSSPIVKNLVKKAKDTATHLWNKNKGKVLKKVKELAGKAMEKGKEAVERVVEAAKAKAKELQAKLGVSQEDLQLMDGITIELRNSDGDAIEHKSLADVLHGVEDKAPCADGRRANGDGSCTEAGKDRPFCVRARTKRFGGSNDKMCKRKGMSRACPESCMGHDHDSLAEVDFIDKCPDGDEVTTFGFAYLPKSINHEYEVSYPNIPGVFSVPSFRFADPASGQIESTINFAKDNVFKSFGFNKSETWCNTRGLQSFRITVYGICLFKSDDEFDYVKIIADNDLQTDCKSQQLPGNGRRADGAHPFRLANEDEAALGLVPR